MRSRVTLIVLVISMCAFAGAAAQKAEHPQQQFQTDWRSFKLWVAQHGKWYQNNPHELAKRYDVWRANVEHINSRAASNGSGHRLGLTAHTDLTPEEFRATYLGAPMTPRDSRPYHHQQQQQQQQQQVSGASAGTASASWGASAREAVQLLGNWLLPTWLSSPAKQQLSKKKQPHTHWRYENVSAPATVDWRGHNPPVLGAIKDQHINGTACGSCWAFSAVSIMEIASAMATGSVVLGSEQQLIDCDRKYDHGCSGGGWLNAIQYTIHNKGIATEQEYPYLGKDGTCNKQLAKQRHVLKVHSWEDVPFSNESALAQAVSQTPVIVAICVGPALDDWHHYAGGIFDAPCCEKDSEVTLDHGIVVVGYGTEAGTDYWLLKNSWGAHWGEQGFMRIKRNHGQHGKCALASYPAMVFRKPLPLDNTAGRAAHAQHAAQAAAAADSGVVAVL